MDDSLSAQCQQAEAEVHDWISGPILLQVCRDVKTSVEEELDLASILPSTNHKQRREGLCRTNFLEGAYFVPERITTTREAIRAYLFPAVLSTGTRLVTGSTREICPGIQAVYFRCMRGNVGKPLPTNPPENGNRRPKFRVRPVLALGEKVCHFNFVILFDKIGHRWFSPRRDLAYGCRCHCGLARLRGAYEQIPSNTVDSHDQIPSNIVDSEQPLKGVNVKEILESHLASIANIITTRNELGMAVKVLKKLKRDLQAQANARSCTRNIASKPALVGNQQIEKRQYPSHGSSNQNKRRKT